MGLHPGALVGSNVRLIRPLSRGGMGNVWRAEHLTLKTEVAVKFVSDALLDDETFVRRFEREAVASARIRSPHAVQILDHGVTADGAPYIVLELLEGEDLRVRLLRERRLPVGETAKIVTQVARGLGRAHAAEVVHRDIKPGNIFLTEQDGDVFVKILDFGIAKRIGDLEAAVTMTGQIVGTPHYVSPEQIVRPREADPRNDLWSLAVVAYKCLTGELPFEGETVGAVSIAIDKAAFVPVTERVPSLPKRLDAWFARAFARAPSARFGSAKELARAFEAAARDEPFEVLPLLDATPASTTGEPAKHADLAEATVPGAARARAAEATVPAAKAGAPEEVAPAAGEPTLSQGTVTHIDATHPSRARVYGAILAAVAIGGAITVAWLSRAGAPGSSGAGPDAAGMPEAAGATSATAATSAPPATSTSTTSSTSSAEPAVTGTATTVEPSAPTSSTKALPAPPPRSTLPRKKRKDRGF